MRSQETPVSGLTMHLLLMHLRQCEWRFSILPISRKVSARGKTLYKVYPVKKEAEKRYLKAIRSPVHSKVSILFACKHVG